MTVTEAADRGCFLTPEALLDLDAVRHNLRRAREAAPHSRAIAVIKSNAYGHGMLRIAAALSADVDAFGLARMEEAVALREAGFEGRLIALEGYFDSCELDAAIDCRIDVVISRSGQIHLLERYSGARRLDCWLKIDTGMNRLGFRIEEAEAAYRRLCQCRVATRNPRLMSHFACADEADNSFNDLQLTGFQTLVERLGGEASMANSAATLSRADSHYQWIRPGIMLYGASPMARGCAAKEGLRPVMTLRSRLIAINHCRAGDSVGYGASWRVPESMPVGVVAIGYGDGYPRHAASGTPLLVNGIRAPLVGRVSMDMVTVDLRGVPGARVGDPVTLWGEGLPAEEVALHAETIAYELFCGVSQRVRMREVSSGGAP
ncbi:MAG: alanine racemase [Gammaproteobacteria bacterium]|nr:alanine racemase [Gammaproteobacteria bacterium]